MIRTARPAVAVAVLVFMSLPTRPVRLRSRPAPAGRVGPADLAVLVRRLVQGTTEMAGLMLMGGISKVKVTRDKRGKSKEFYLEICLLTLITFFL